MERKIDVYSFFIFLIFIISMEVWFGWNHKSYALAICGLFALIVKLANNIPMVFSRKNILLCISFFGGYYLLHPQFGVREFFTQIPPQLTPIICIICIHDMYKQRILSNITKWYACLIAASMVVFLFSLFVSLPNFGYLKFGDTDRYGTFINYLVYLKEFGSTVGSSGRFGGPFLEPGYVGMMGAFLLVANKYNFRNRYVQIILLSTIVSLSLAGWALAFIGYVLVRYYEGRIYGRSAFLFIIFCLLFITVGQWYNGGDNIVNNEILSRLQYDSEKGFTGNNRNVETMTIFFIEMWNDPRILIHGYPETAFYGLSDWETIGAGLDRFMVFHGLLGILYVFLIYIIAIMYAKDKKFAIIFFLFVLASFWQRTYAQWFSWIICFYYASIIQDSKRKQISLDIKNQE